MTDCTLSFIDARIEKMFSAALPGDIPYMMVMFDAKRSDWKKKHKIIIAQSLTTETPTEREKDAIVQVSKKMAYDTVMAQKGEPE